MDLPSFIPRQAKTSDVVSQYLFKTSRLLILAIVGILPLLFVPGLLGFTSVIKIFAVFTVVVLATIIVSLAILRHGQVTLRPAPLLLAWWAIALTAVVSGLFSPNPSYAIWGDMMEIHTVAFLLLGAVLMSLLQLFKDSKTSIVYLYSCLFVSAFVVSILHISRLIFGPDVLSFGLLSSPAATLLGSFNDLALFLSLVVMVGLVTLLQLSLSKLVAGVLSTIIIISVVMLGIINFFSVWLVIGLFSLMLIMYTLTKDRFGLVANHTKLPSLVVTLLSLFVFVTSAVFIIGGPSLGSWVVNLTGISYLEVRPSAAATLDIIRAVYSADAVTGIGPNQFAEAWALYKDSAINQTMFWNVAFNAGGGYIPTWFVTSGLLSVFAWFTFLGLLVWSGVQALLKTTSTDDFWYFIGLISHLSSLFVWGIALIYVPGPVILILGIVSTGIFIVSYQALVPRQVSSINLLTSARTGFVLIVAVMIIILTSVYVGYQGFRHFMAAKVFANAQALSVSGAQTADVTNMVVEAYSFAESDVFARELAAYYLLTIQNLISSKEPSQEEIDQIKSLPVIALESATQAINNRPTDARNWVARANIYAYMASLKVESAKERAIADYKEAEVRDPKNPFYPLQMAMLAIGAGEEAEARNYIRISLERKPNYTEAIFVLSQLDIATGNIENAIKATEALISLEANNPVRYYQLGVLQVANKNNQAAVVAFSQAVKLNPQYANARYLLALEYIKLNNKEAALKELAVVREFNPDNSTVTDLITQIESGQVTAESLSEAQNAVSEPQAEVSEESVVTTDQDPKTDLLTPVNTVPEAATEEIIDADEVSTDTTSI